MLSGGQAFPHRGISGRRTAAAVPRLLKKSREKCCGRDYFLPDNLLSFLAAADWVRSATPVFVVELPGDFAGALWMPGARAGVIASPFWLFLFDIVLHPSGWPVARHQRTHSGQSHRLCNRQQPASVQQCMNGSIDREALLDADLDPDDPAEWVCQWRVRLLLRWRATQAGWSDRSD